MTQKAQLIVRVSDHENRPCPFTAVSSRSLDIQAAQALVYDDAMRAHHRKKLEPGRVEVCVEGPSGWHSARRIVELAPGDNQLRVTLAPLGTPFYTAAGGVLVFFRPVPDELLLCARGSALRSRLETELGRMSTVRWQDDRAGSPPTPGDLVALQLKFKGPSSQRTREMGEVARLVAGLSAAAPGRLLAPLVLSSGEREWLSNELITCFHADTSSGDQQALATRYGLVVTRRSVPYLGHACVFQRPGVPHHDILELASELERENAVSSVSPNIVYHARSQAPHRPNDFLYPEQAALDLIKAPEAWALLRGAGAPSIAVAIVDLDGVDPDHPNLPNKIANWNFAHSGEQIREQLGGNHGTQCASSAVGQIDDEAGTAGVAGGCRWIGARIPEYHDALEVADAWCWAAGLSEEGAGDVLPSKLSQSADVWPTSTRFLR